MKKKPKNMGNDDLQKEDEITQNGSDGRDDDGGNGGTDDDRGNDGIDNDGGNGGTDDDGGNGGTDDDGENNGIDNDDENGGTDDDGENNGIDNDDENGGTDKKKNKINKQEIKNELADIDTQNNVNQGTLNQNTYNNYYTDKERKENSIDHLKKFPETLLGSLKVQKSKKVIKAYENLNSRKIILLSCLDETIAYSATYTLIELIKQREKIKYDYRLLTTQQVDEKKPQNVYLSLFTDENLKIGRGSNLVVAIDARNDLSFKSLFNLGVASKNILFNQLEQKNIKLICFISSHSQIKELKERLNRDNYAYWNVDFLAPLLKHYFNNQWDVIRKTINIQKEKGLWGKDKWEFYQLIVGYLENGSYRLEEEIEKRKKYGGINLEGFIDKEIENVKPISIVEKGKIHKAIAFIATFFPNLNLTEFRKIAKFLLKGKEKKRKIPNKKRKKNYQKIILLEIWEDEGDQILKECYIIASKKKLGEEYFKFSEPYLQDDFKEYFDKERIYLQQQFEIILESKLFLEYDISPKLIENLIALSVNMAIKNPITNGLTRLLKIIWDIEFLNVKNNNSTFIEQKINHKIKSHHITRLGFLMSEMLKHQKLKDLIENLLNSFIETGFHQIVFDLMKILRFSPDFDKFHWIKRLLDSDKLEVRKQAYIFLLKIAHENPLELHDFLDEIICWHPNSNRSVTNYSHSNCFSLGFIIDYTLNIVYTDYGKWPSTYPLFTKKTTFSKRDKKIIEWMFHPNLSYAYNKIQDLFKLKKLNIHTLQLEALINWFDVFNGTKKKKTCKEGQAFFNDLLTEASSIINKTTTKKEKRLFFLSLSYEMENTYQIINKLETVSDMVIRINYYESGNLIELKSLTDEIIQKKKNVIYRFKKIQNLQKKIKKKIKELKKSS